jgi:lipopolysaccharide/colanic/teichoic acid biosynthesis glycosyltransferase
MDIALQNRSFSHPLQVSYSSLKCIVWIEANAMLGCSHEYTHKGICFYQIPSIDEASLLIQEGRLKIDAAVITPDNSVADIFAIKEVARQGSIPLVMYTSVFDEATSELTGKLGVDEYYHGMIGHAFLKRIEFVKKIKEYKNHHSHRPNVAMYLKVLSKTGRWALKRTFDLFGSSIALLALSPIFLLIAIGIRLGSKGPVFLVCKRVGMGYNTFNLYKFRSKTETNLQHRGARLGKFLEDSGLDELPSLLNVLKGDMSLVGSKPLLLAQAENLTKDQMAMRLMSPVGFTGSWRIKEQSIIEKPSLDLEFDYALRNSFWTDMKILFFTFLSLLLQQKV